MAAAVSAPIRLSLSLAGTHMTPEEFDAVQDCDEAYRYELIHGVLVVTPMASLASSIAVPNLSGALVEICAILPAMTVSQQSCQRSVGVSISPQ